MRVVSAVTFGAVPNLFTGLFIGLFTSVQAQTFDPPLCERSPVVQLAILAAANVDSGCAAFDPNALQGVTTLDMSDRAVRELKSGDFNGLGRVATLNLSGNQLESLPAGVLDGLTGLRTLDLSDNELQSLRFSAFSGAGSLQVLDLSDNRLQVLPWQGAFRGLGNLRELNLERNRLQGGIRGNRFTDLGNLRRLDLSDNRLEDLEADLLGDTPKLKQLDLRNNRLEFLRAKLFDGRNFNPAVVDGYGGSLLLSGNPGLDGDPQTPLALIMEVRARALSREKDCLDMRGTFCFLSINVWRADVEAYLAQGAPFDFDFRWDAVGDHSDNPLGTGDSFSAGRRSNNNRDRVRYSSRESPPEISDLRVFFTSSPSLPQGDSGCGFNPCYDGFVIRAPTDNSEDCKLRPGCYRNRANFGHNSNAVDWSQTRVRDVRFVSTPEDSDGYGTGLETFEIDVLFDRRIVVVEGKPELVVRIGSVERRASYVPSEDGSGTIRFRYRLSRDDSADSDGIEVLRIDRNGATIDDMLIGHNSPDIGDLRGHGGRFPDQKVQQLSFILFDAATASVREGSGVDLSFTLDPPRAAGGLAAVLSISGGEPFDVQRSQHSLDRSGGVVRVSIPDNDWIGRARDTFTVSLQDSRGYIPADVQTVEVEIEEGVCDRTPKVRDALMEATRRDGCAEVTNEDLGAVVDLDLSDLGIERLNPRDFLGLSGLRGLDLRDNKLQILPAGIFEGLAKLGDASSYLLLENNPGAPFDFVFQMGIVEIRAQGNEEVVAVSPYLAQGAPFDLTFKTENYNFRFDAGDLRGQRQEITLLASGSLSFIHDVPGSLDLPSLPRGGCDLARCYTGFGFSSEGSGDTIYRYRSQRTVSVNRFEFTSHPQDADGYVAGVETIIVEVEFDDKVAVSPSQIGGMPSLVLEIGSTTRVASYAPASSVTNVWRFAYTLREDDVDVDGIRVASRDGLKLNGATGVGLIHEFQPGSVRLPNSADDTDPEHKVQLGTALSFDAAAVSHRKDSTLELPFNVLPVARSAFVVEYVVEGADFAYSGRIAVSVGSRRELIRIPIGADGEAFEVRLRPSDDYFLFSPSRTAVTVKAGICDRTPQVRDELLSVLGKNDCADVSNQDLTRVERMDLNDAGVASLRSEDFSGLTNLRWLLLNDNRLQSLPSGLFEGLGNLGTLELRRNQLQSLRRDAFSGLGKLNRLRLQSNRLSSLPPGVFSGVGQAGWWLFLSDNPLSSLPPGVFSGTDGLEWLNLGNNAMTELPAGIFSGIPESLRTLVLGDSRRSTFGLALRFEFAGGDEGLLTDSSGDITKAFVKLTLREGAPYRLRGKLRASSGFVHSVLPEQVGRQMQFFIDVEIPPGATQSNTFEVLPGAASTLTVRLDDPSPLPEDCLSWQRGADGRCFSGLEIVPPAPFTLLDVSADTSICDRTQAVQDTLNQLWEAGEGANCRNFPADLLRIATSLDLSGADLSSLTSSDFAGMESLERLDLSSSTGLQALGANAFGGLGSLRRLDLSSMGLRTLDPQAFAGLESLEQLLLHDNDLRELPVGIFSGLSGLGVPSGSLRVEDNPDASSPHFVLSAVFRVAQVTGNALDFHLYLAQGAPFELSFPLAAQGSSSPAPPTMVIRAGSTRSETVSVTRQAGRTLRLSLGDPPSLLQGNLGGNSGCGYAPCYDGFEIASGSPIAYDGTRRAARITAVEFSAPRHFADGYVAGVETMIVDVIFDKSLIVDTTNGAPTLQLQVGRNVRVASYLPGRTDVDRLRFSYALASADVDDDGVHVVSSGLELNGATARDIFGVNAALSLTGFLDPVADRKVRQTSWVSFETSSVRFREGVMAALSFRLDPPAPPGLMVGYRVGAPGDVADADDYGDGSSGMVSGVVAVGTGATRGTVRIQIRDDEVAEPVEEFFTVSLSPSDDYFVAAPSTARVVIVEGVCDRTPRVREVLTSSRFSGCTAVTEAYLSSLRDLDLSSTRMATVKQGDFLGLTGLEGLSLNANFLRSLPEGVFSGLTSLEALHLDANPGSPFSFPLRVELAGGPQAPLVANQPVPVRLTLRHGAPYVFTVGVSFSGGSSSTPNVTFSAGSTQSEVFFVTRASNAMNLGVTLSVSSPPNSCDSDRQQGGQCFTGFDVVPDDRSFRATPGSPGSAPTVCGRTPGIRDAILRLPGSPASCVGFPYEALGFAAYLDASNVGLSAVSRADLVPMIRLQDLDLSGNARLQALDESVFADLGDLMRLDLSSGGLRELHPRAFAGLGGLRQLLLQDNDLQTLPAGIFEGLAGLGEASGSLRLEGNAPADGSSNFTLTAQLEAAGSSGDDLDFYLYLAEGAPFDLRFPLTATGSAGSVPSTMGISVGSTRSETVRATRAGQTLSLSLGAAPALPQGDLGGDSGCGYDPCYAGFEIASGDPLDYSRALPRPQVTGVEFSAPRYFADAYLNDGADPGGETFTVDVIFDQELSVDVSNGEPRLLLEIAGAATTATYVSAVGLSARLRFSYTVGCHSSFGYCDSDDADGVHVASADALLLDGAVVADALGTAVNPSLAAVLNASPGPGVRTGGLLRFDAASVEVVEGEMLELGLTASLIPQTAITASYRVGVPGDMVGDVADADDYTDAGNGEVDVGVARTPIRISIRDDEAIDAPRERFTVSLIDSGSDAYFLVSPMTVTVTIKEGVCDRTEQVRDALTTAVGANACTDVTASDLFGQTELDLSEEGIASLKGGDFSGLPRLRSLQLNDNDLQTLPAGIFAGLDLGLPEGSLHLRGNPDVASPDLVFTVEFRFVRLVPDDQGAPRAELVLYLAQGAPFDVTVPLVAVGANGSPVPSEATIPAGEVQSTRFSVSRQAGETVTLRLGAPIPVFLPRGGCGTPPCYSGFRIAASETRFVYDDSLVQVERDLRLSFDPAAVVLRAGGSSEVVALTLKGNKLLDMDETVVVTLTPSPGLEVRSESGESLTMVTLGRDAEATTRVRVSANRDADHATPDAENLNAAVALPNNARVAESTLRVTVAQREIRVLFEPGRITLVRGGAAKTVTMRTEPELQSGEVLVVSLSAIDVAVVSPTGAVRLTPANNAVPVTLGATGATSQSSVRRTVSATLDEGASSLGNARVTTEALAVEVIRGVNLSLSSLAGQDLVRFDANETTEVRVTTDPVLEGDERVTVTVSVDRRLSLESAGKLVLSAMNPSATVAVTTDISDLNLDEGVSASGEGENVGVVGGTASLRVRTDQSKKETVKLSPSPVVEVQQGGSTPLRVTIEPRLTAGQEARVSLTIEPDNAGLSFFTAVSPSIIEASSATVTVYLHQKNPYVDVGVAAAPDAVIGNTAQVTSRVVRNTSVEVGVDSRSRVTLEATTPQATIRFDPAPLELDLGTDKTVTLSFDDGFTLRGSQTAEFMVSVEGEGLSLQGGTPTPQVLNVSLSARSMTAEVTVLASAEAASVGRLVVRPVGDVELEDGAETVSLPIKALQEVNLSFDPNEVLIPRSRSAQFGVAIKPPLIADRQMTVTLAISDSGFSQGFTFGAGRTQRETIMFDAGKSSETVTVATTAEIGSMVPVGVEVTRFSGIRTMGQPTLGLRATGPLAALDLTPAGGAPGDELVLNTGTNEVVTLSLRGLTLSGGHVAEFEVSVEGEGLSLQGGTPTPQVLNVSLSAGRMTEEVTVLASAEAASVGRLVVRPVSGVELADGMETATLPIRVLQSVSLVFDPNLVEIQRGRNTEFEVALNHPLIADRQTTVTLTISGQDFAFDGGQPQHKIRFDAGKSRETVRVATTAEIGSMVPVSVGTDTSSGVDLARLPGLTLKTTTPRVTVEFDPSRLSLTQGERRSLTISLYAGSQAYRLAPDQDVMLTVAVEGGNLKVTTDPNPSATGDSAVKISLSPGSPAAAVVTIIAGMLPDTGSLTVSSNDVELVGNTRLQIRVRSPSDGTTLRIRVFLEGALE